MPNDWVIRVLVPTRDRKAKPIYSKPMTWTKARRELVRYQVRGHQADIREVDDEIREEIRRQTL